MSGSTPVLCAVEFFDEYSYPYRASGKRGVGQPSACVALNESGELVLFGGDNDSMGRATPEDAIKLASAILFPATETAPTVWPLIEALDRVLGAREPADARAGAVITLAAVIGLASKHGVSLDEIRRLLK